MLKEADQGYIELNAAEGAGRRAFVAGLGAHFHFRQFQFVGAAYEYSRNPRK